jgi:hypothetical protein
LHICCEKRWSPSGNALFHQFLCCAAHCPPLCGIGSLYAQRFVFASSAIRKDKMGKEIVTVCTIIPWNVFGGDSK